VLYPVSDISSNVHCRTLQMRTMQLLRAKCAKRTTLIITNTKATPLQQVIWYLCPLRTYCSQRDVRTNFYQSLSVHSKYSMPNQVHLPIGSSCRLSYKHGTCTTGSTRARFALITRMMTHCSHIGKCTCFMTTAPLTTRSGL